MIAQLKQAAESSEISLETTSRSEDSSVEKLSGQQAKKEEAKDEDDEDDEEDDDEETDPHTEITIPPKSAAKSGAKLPFPNRAKRLSVGKGNFIGQTARSRGVQKQPKHSKHRPVSRDGNTRSILLKKNSAGSAQGSSRSSRVSVTPDSGFQSDAKSSTSFTNLTKPNSIPNSPKTLK